MIRVSHKGNFTKTQNFLKRAKTFSVPSLEKFGAEGVTALSIATPVDTGETAASWYYRIRNTGESVIIEWLNRHVVDDVPIAIIIQYGHSTGSGAYVEGIDYINPAMKPLFEEIARKAWKEVTGR